MWHRVEVLVLRMVGRVPCDRSRSSAGGEAGRCEAASRASIWIRNDGPASVWRGYEVSFRSYFDYDNARVRSATT